MVVCAVYGCNNNQKTPNISMYRIPDDHRRKEFIRRLGRADQKDNRNWRICSAHFTDDAYERNALREYVCARGKASVRKLRPDALPTEELHEKVKIEHKSADGRKSRARIREAKKARAANSEEAEVVLALHESLHEPEPESLQRERELQTTKEKLRCVEQQLDAAKGRIANMQTRIRKLWRSRNFRQRRFRKAYVKSRRSTEILGRLKSKYNAFTTAVKRVLSPPQLRVLQLRKGTSARWSPAEIGKALVLRKFSRRAYSFARGTLLWPLPHPRTLQRWSRPIPARPGFQPAAQVLFAHLRHNSKDFLRLAIIGFDEMKLSSQPSYSSKNDRVYIASQAQTFVARALFGKWKVILYYNYDTNATKELILHVINYAEENGIRVMGLVCAHGTG